MAKNTKDKSRKKLSPVIADTSIKKRKPTVKDKLADVFLSDDRGNVADYLVFDVLIPAIKDTICNLGHAALDRSFYGEDRPRYGDRTSGGHTSTYSYSSCFSKQSTTARENRERGTRTRGVFDFDQFVFRSRAEAQDVLENLIMRIVDTDYATVADFYDLVDVQSDFTMESWGWYDLEKAFVMNTRGGYIVRLPKPQRIR